MLALAIILATIGYLAAARLVWVAVGLGLNGHCEAAVAGLGHRLVNTTCHRAAAHASGALPSWLLVAGLLMVAFVVTGLGSALVLWAFGRRGRRDAQRA